MTTTSRTRWWLIVIAVVVLAAIGLQVGGAFSPRTDRVTAVAVGETFASGPFELRIDGLDVMPQEYRPETDQVVVHAHSRLNDTTTVEWDRNNIALRLPNGERIEPIDQRVNGFPSHKTTPVQPRMPMRPHEFTFDIPADTLTKGDVVVVEVRGLTLQHDKLHDRDSWQPDERSFEVTLQV